MNKINRDHQVDEKKRILYDQTNDNLGKHIDEDKRYSKLYASNECLSTNNLIGKRNSR
ncbi:MAG: hypothetical protein WCF06_09755 [Nitrososphaeraceae archaeon]